MGIYLSTPKTEKLSEDGESKRLRYGLSSMQGWRATMEDAVSAQSANLSLLSCDLILNFWNVTLDNCSAVCL